MENTKDLEEKCCRGGSRSIHKKEGKKVLRRNKKKPERKMLPNTEGANEERPLSGELRIRSRKKRDKPSNQKQPRPISNRRKKKGKNTGYVNSQMPIDAIKRQRSAK